MEHRVFVFVVVMNSELDDERLFNVEADETRIEKKKNVVLHLSIVEI